MRYVDTEGMSRTWIRVMSMVRFGVDVGYVQIEGISPARWRAMVKQVARYLNCQW